MIRPRSFPRRSSWILAVSTTSLLVAGCAADGGDAAPPGGSGGPSGGVGVGGGGTGGDGAGGATGDDVAVGACPLGARRACRVHHGEGCAEGLQYCIEGIWSDCARSVVDDGMQTRALTDPALECGAPGTTRNTCDAACQAFDPAAPDLGAGSSAAPDWATGSLGDIPPDVLDDGLEGPPCNDLRDCQFDHVCDESSSPAVCRPNAPGSHVTACESGQPSRPDITLGVPCDDTVPLCNRGAVTLTAAQTDAIELKWREHPNPSMEGCNIGASTVCDVPAVELAPGECMNVACAMPADVYVFADYDSNGECECANNWTYNGDSACEPPSCGGSVSSAGEVPVMMFFSIDISGSMLFDKDCPYADECAYYEDPDEDACCIKYDDATEPDTRWYQVAEALKAFARDDASAGLGAALKFWPDGSCESSDCKAVGEFIGQGTCAHHPCDRGVDLADGCTEGVEDVCDARPGCCGSGSPNWTATNNNQCIAEFNDATSDICRGGREACNQPTYPEDCRLQGLDACRISFAAGVGDSGETIFVDAIDAQSPEGGTPSAVALEGAVDFAKRYEAAHPDEQAIVVFVSDGQPSQCGSADDVYDAAGAGLDDGIQTYAIALGAAGTSFMNQVADEGGTGAAFLADAGDGTGDFVAALQAIRSEFACSYTVPTGTDPELVRIVWNDGAVSTPMTEVPDETACGVATNGWFWSGADEITMCADTCEDVRGDADSNLQIVIDCAESAEPATVVEPFSAAHACDDQTGTFPFWTILLYTADVPEASSILVDVRTRHDAAATWSDWVDVETITSANATSTLASPTSLATPLGPAAFAEDLEIRFTTTVEGGAPTLVDYEVQFTCAPSE